LAYEGRGGERLPEGDSSAGSSYAADERGGGGGGLEGDELRMQRSEEELGTGVRKREAGSMNVRKSVRTEREQVRVPRRREEVDVERVAVGREVAEAEEIGGGEEEFVVRVYEEEVVVTKRVVLKEEIRLRKRVVEEVEVFEVELRKEEVEIGDRTEYGGRRGERQEPLPPGRG
jgi:uncharacterized protein (TIGR02271 family)